MVQGLETVMVGTLRSTLMTPSWNHVMLEDLFKDTDRSLITKIPLSIKDNEDSWKWRIEGRVVRLNLHKYQISISHK